MAHGPMTKGLAAVPLPLVTQPQVAKSVSEVMVIAACPPVPAEPGTAGRANRTPAVKVDNRTSSRRMWVLPYIPSRQFLQPPSPSSPNVAGRDRQSRAFDNPAG